jgi:hydroxymethylbilane synthase
MTVKPVIVGTRKSPLAMAQARQAVEQLMILSPEKEFIIRTVSTAGDRDRSPAALLGRQGIFVKELEDALLNGDIDLAVHSLKDMPCDISPGLLIAAVGERADSRDALVSRDGRVLSDLRTGARIGTSSARRRAQVLCARGDLEVVPLRGNVDTRLRKLRDGEADAIIMACAGILRLGEEACITERVSTDVMLPAPGQGAVAIEARSDDRAMRGVAACFNHPPTAACVTAERSFLRSLGAGCSLPVAALGVIARDTLALTGEVLSPDGRKRSRYTLKGPVHEARQLGQGLAEVMLRADGSWIMPLLQGVRCGGAEQSI